MAQNRRDDELQNFKEICSMILFSKNFFLKMQLKVIFWCFSAKDSKNVSVNRSLFDEIFGNARLMIRVV